MSARVLAVAAAALVLATSTAPALAQAQNRPPAQPSRPGQPATPAPPTAPAPPPPAVEQPVPYEKDLLRLAEVLGSLAFLRSLCGGQDAAEWPARMQALLDAEGTSPSRKERLAGAYNRGYRGFALTYRVCTDSATEATNRYVKEGDQITRNLASRYGG